MDNDRKGVFWILISTFFLALMGVVVKWTPEIPIFEKVLARNFIGAIIMFFIIKRKNIPFKLNHAPLMLYRSANGTLGILTQFWAISLLPLSNAVIINSLSPFFVLFLAYFFLKEKIRSKSILAILIAMCGALLVVKPASGVDLFPSLIGVSSAFFAASTFVLLRKLKEYNPPEINVFYFLVFSVILISPLMLTSFLMPSPQQIIKLLVIGVFGTITQITMTVAYKYAEASKLAIYIYLNIVMSSIIAVFMFKEIPDFLSICGGTLIITGGYVNYKAALKSKQTTINEEIKCQNSHL
ncbi:MAG: DMT family transporter [Peptostreptococcaceae bacterium]|nr:DMT family transporter [Peptostreptococcaceae bacterium]